MNSENFWAAKRAEYNKKNPQPVSVPSSAPWWLQGTQDPRNRKIAPQNPSQGHTEASENIIDGHDVSKAGILRGAAEECPMCPKDPNTGIRGNMYRPSPSSAMRCFDCGYMDNNRFLGETAGMSAVSEGKSYKAKQVASGGGTVNNNHGNIKSSSQAVGIIS